MIVKKILSFLYKLVGALLLVALGVLLGGKFEQQTMEQEQGIENTGLIAVVNLDSGVETDGIVTNYASGLINLPSDNFTYVGLEEARSGLANGTYAAYVMIPENFSKNIASVESVPETVQIQYDINPNLREDVMNKVLNDIHAFEVNLNANISYMYITAIMEEFHEGQDAAATIMENDNKELAVINGIDGQSLLAELVVAEAAYPENTIEYKDFSMLLQNNQAQISALKEYHAQCLQEAMGEFATIHAQDAAMQASIQAVKQRLASLNLTTDPEGNLIYQEGLDNLATEITAYNDLLEVEKRTIKETMGWSIDENGVVSYAMPAEMQAVIEQEIQQAVDAAILANNERLQLQMEQIYLCAAALEYDEDADEIVGLTELQAALAGVTPFEMSAIPVRSDVLQPWQESAVTLVDAMSQPDTEAWNNLFNEQIVQVVMTRANEENVLLDQESALAIGQIDSYAESLGSYDPFALVDEAQLNTYLDAIGENVSVMENDVNQTTFDQQMYVTDLYSAVLMNENAWKTGLDNAYSATAGNVDSTVATLKQSRTTINALNVTLLKEFSNRLANTRLGKVEYTQMYDFVSHPLMMENLESQQKQVFEIRDYDTVILTVGGVIIIWAVCGLMWSIIQWASRRKEAEE